MVNDVADISYSSANIRNRKFDQRNCGAELLNLVAGMRNEVADFQNDVANIKNHRKRELTPPHEPPHSTHAPPLVEFSPQAAEDSSHPATEVLEMTQQNLVSIVITDEDEQEVMQSIARIETRLKGLISLAPHKRRFKRMGQTQEARARGIIRALQQNPQMVPPGLDVAGAVADLAAFERIARIDDAMQRVSSLVNDTRAGLGIDIMSVAKVGYTLSKTFGGALGLGDLVKEFGSRFAGGRKKKEAEPEEEPKP